jgi:hypothetical protein
MSGAIIVAITTIEETGLVVDVVIPPLAPLVVDIVEPADVVIDVTAPPGAPIIVDAIALAGPPGGPGPPGSPGSAGPAGPQGPPGVGFPDAPSDGALYGRQSLGWHKALPLDGGGLVDGSITTTSFIAATDRMAVAGAANANYQFIIGGQQLGQLQQQSDGTVNFSRWAPDGSFLGPLWQTNPAGVTLFTAPTGDALQAYNATPYSCRIALDIIGFSRWSLGPRGDDGHFRIRDDTNGRDVLTLDHSSGGTTTCAALTIQSGLADPLGPKLFIKSTSSSWPGIELDSGPSTVNAAGYIASFRDGKSRWTMEMGGSTAESGANTGTNFALRPFNDDGTPLPVLLTIQRTGLTTLAGPLTVSGAATFNGASQFNALATLSGGLTFGSQVASAPGDLTKHLLLYDPGFGISVTSARLNLVASSGTIAHVIGGADRLTVTNAAATFTVPLTVNGSLVVGPTGVVTLGVGGNTAASVAIALNTATGQTRTIQWLTANVLRWQMFPANAEGGSNAGADFTLNRYNDAGSGLGSALTITRSTGAMTVGGGLTIQGALVAAATGAANTFITFGNNLSTLTSFVLNGAVGTNRQIVWQTAGVARWNMLAGSGPESGGNIGSAFALVRYDDAGSNLGNVFTVARDTGLFTLSGPLTVSGALTQAGAATFSSLITANLGLTFGSVIGASSSDLTKHIALYGGNVGFSVSSGARFNIVIPSGFSGFFVANGADVAQFNGGGLTVFGNFTVGVAGGSPGLNVGNNTGLVANIYLNAVQGSNSRNIFFQTGGVSRWVTRAVNAEAGSNSGSNFDIARFDDSGTNLGSAMTILRSNGQVTLGAALQVTGAAGFNGTAPLAKPAITGSRGGNAAVAALLTALASYGLVTDSTTA